MRSKMTAADKLIRAKEDIRALQSRLAELDRKCTAYAEENRELKVRLRDAEKRAQRPQRKYRETPRAAQFRKLQEENRLLRGEA